ncbi:septum formation initiator family protein [Rothia sp. ZJ1223]|uniref:FtsB family cell division protein n=1 Tax=Rothia sp. ZJ1223 TaxID=2811098 RepID=UPI00195DEACE|nr:septum formation initiator family protein [Rothia sp. ZJ1223]MBM7051454.1 septum formation initiator family protein [Rothia sp. ZJ1223]
MKKLGNISGARLQGFFGSRRAPAGVSARRDDKPTRQVGQGANVPVAARAFSGKWVAALVVFALVALAVYGTLSRYITQSAEIAQVQSNISRLETENRELAVQQSWWQDDNYVQQQAKGRLFYVNPGETPYLVVGTDYTTELADETSANALTAPEDNWTTKLWDSFQLSAVNGDPAAYRESHPSSDAGSALSTDLPSSSAETEGSPTQGSSSETAESSMHNSSASPESAGSSTR